MIATSSLFEFRRALEPPGDELERLTRGLREAKARFAGSSLHAILDDLLAARPRCRAALSSGARLDHLGFVLPTWCKPIVSRAATAAGFPLAHAAFPSALFTRELGRLVGSRRVPTSIFKAYGRCDDGSMLAFEAFIPSTDAARVEEWVRAGVGRHVALELDDPERFAQVRALFAAEGLALSTFMYGRPLYLAGENATIAYFDLDRDEFPVRLEIRIAGDQAGEADE